MAPLQRDCTRKRPEISTWVINNILLLAAPLSSNLSFFSPSCVTVDKLHTEPWERRHMPYAKRHATTVHRLSPPYLVAMCAEEEAAVAIDRCTGWLLYTGVQLLWSTCGLCDQKSLGWIEMYDIFYQISANHIILTEHNYCIIVPFPYFSDISCNCFRNDWRW